MPELRLSNTCILSIWHFPAFLCLGTQFRQHFSTTLKHFFKKWNHQQKAQICKNVPNSLQRLYYNMRAEIRRLRTALDLSSNISCCSTHVHICKQPAKHPKYLISGLQTDFSGWANLKVHNWWIMKDQLYNVLLLITWISF